MPTGKFETIGAFHEWLDYAAGDRFNRRRVYEHGNWTALYDAILDLVRAAERDADAGADNEVDLQITLPYWIAKALCERALPLAMHALAIRADSFRQQLATSHQGTWTMQRWRKDMIDWQRYKEVWYRKIAVDDDGVSYLQNLNGSMQANRIAFFEKHGRIADHLPYPWTSSGKPSDLDVFDAAAAILKRSIYAGTNNEMRKSYERVTKALNAREAWRYYASKWCRYDPRQARTAEEDCAR